jgi:hypothetical protein
MLPVEEAAAPPAGHPGHFEELMGSRGHPSQPRILGRLPGPNRHQIKRTQMPRGNELPVLQVQGRSALFAAGAAAAAGGGAIIVVVFHIACEDLDADQ